MYHQENFSTDFDCKIQCEKITFTMFMEHTLQIFLSSNVSSWGLMPPSNQSCVSACETQRIQSLDLGCNKICENITTSDDFIHLRRKVATITCYSSHLPIKNFFGPKYFSEGKNIFWPKIFFRQKNFFGEKLIFGTNFFWQNYFWSQNSFGIKIVFGQSIFRDFFFRLKFCWTQNLFHQIFLLFQILRGRNWKVFLSWTLSIWVLF